MDHESEMFPMEFLNQTPCISILSKTLILEKEKLLKMLFSLENTAETLIFMALHFIKLYTLYLPQD